MSTTAHSIPELNRKGLREFGLTTGGIVGVLFGAVSVNSCLAPAGITAEPGVSDATPVAVRFVFTGSPPADLAFFVVTFVCWPAFSFVTAGLPSSFRQASSSYQCCCNLGATTPRTYSTAANVR